MASTSTGSAVRTRPPKAHEISLMQHGLSLVERAIYAYLRKKGGGAPKDAVIEAKGGYHTIGKEIGVGPKAVKRNIRSLAVKGVIQPIPGSSTFRAPTKFRVFAYSIVLERWKAEGLTHYTRNRAGGVTLCAVPSDDLESRRPHPVGSQRPHSSDHGDPTPGAAVTPRPGVAVTTEKRYESTPQSSSSGQQAKGGSAAPGRGVAPPGPPPASGDRRGLEAPDKNHPDKVSVDMVAEVFEGWPQSEGFERPAGSINLELITRRMEEAGATIQDLKRFQSTYIARLKRLKIAPGDWRHVEKSMLVELGGLAAFGRDESDAMDSADDRDSRRAFEKWKEEQNV